MSDSHSATDLDPPLPPHLSFPQLLGYSKGCRLIPTREISLRAECGCDIFRVRFSSRVGNVPEICTCTRSYANVIAQQRYTGGGGGAMPNSRRYFLKQLAGVASVLVGGTQLVGCLGDSDPPPSAAIDPATQSSSPTATAPTTASMPAPSATSQAAVNSGP